MTTKEVKNVDTLLDQAFGQGFATAMAAAAAKPSFKDIWPAIKAILMIAKGVFGLFKPAWKVAIDVFIAGMDTYVAGGTIEPGV